MIKKWFTLLELVLVISVIATIFAMSQALFVNPNQDLVSSEICINTINGQFSKFFYEGVTGKDQLNKATNTFISPVQYKILVDNEDFQTRIAFSVVGENGQTTEIFWNDIKVISNCQTSRYAVVLSGAILQNNDMLSVTINKNLSNKNGGAGMTICSLNSTPTWLITTCWIFAATIDYLVCPNNGTALSMDKCKHTSSVKFETTTQSLKINKCLDVSYNDTTCKKRSDTSF